MASVLANPSEKGIAMAHEATIRYIEYLDEIKKTEIGVYDPSVILTVKGTTVKFGNINQVADWLSEIIE